MWQCKEVKWRVFYRLEPQFEIMGVFFVFVFVFVFFCVCFCLDKCFSMIWMIDDSALC